MTTKKRRPRILIVAEMFFPVDGGSERLTHNLALMLHRRGFRPIVYTRTMEGDKAFDDTQPYQVIRSRNWARLYELNRRGALTSRISRLLTAPYLLAVFLSMRLDVMLGIHLASVSLPGRVLRWMGRPVCVWALGEEIEVGLRSSFMRFQIVNSLKMASRVFAISGETAGMVESVGVSPEKISLLFPCPDRSFFAPLPENREQLRATWMPKEQPGELLFVTVTRLAERKGIDTVLHALAECRENGSANKRPWRYLIAGVGDDKPRLRKLVDKLQLKDQVHFLGSITESEKRDLNEAADLFLMPNRQLPNGEKEGFGIVFVEAALRGTPSLGGRSGGTGDAIGEEISGWLVDPDSPQPTAEMLATFFDDPSLLTQNREAIREWALDTFRPHLRHDAVVEVLRKLIS